MELDIFCVQLSQFLLIGIISTYNQTKRLKIHYLDFFRLVKIYPLHNGLLVIYLVE